MFRAAGGRAAAGLLAGAVALFAPGPVALGWASPASSPVASPGKARVDIVYLGLRVAEAAPSAALVLAPVRHSGLAGARLAASDNDTTGQFTGQVTAMTVSEAADARAVMAAAAAALAAGHRLFVTDLPASLLLQVADLPAAHDALILDAATADDRLRAADCRANVLHVLPSRAMLADGLMQYLVAKDWRRILLLRGRDAEDHLYADAIRAAAGKFQVVIADERDWAFNPAAQQADTGHYQVADEVKSATQGVSYDVLVVADEAGHFGDDVAYRTAAPRPVAGTQGLVPAAWSGVMDEYASTQLQLRFIHVAGRPMEVADYGGWLAVRAVGEAATRAGSAATAAIIRYMRGADFAVSGYKGPEFSFRPWDGQLRQPVLLSDDRSLVSVSPQPGFLHEKNDLDSLGVDEPETACRK